LARFWSAFDAYIIDGIVNGAAALTRFVSWLNGLFDAYIIDGLVNAIANVTFWTGNKFRRLQTGNINGYLFVILLAMALAVYVKVHFWS
jgi:NADH-quinone oxidoreductase subunit L